VSDWEVIRLADVVDCRDSLRRPVRSADRRPGPYPYYGASGIVDHVDGYLLDGMYALVAEDGENLRSRKTPVAFLARGKFWVNNHAHILSGTAATDVRYLAYRLENADLSPFLSGSTQPKLTQEALLSMRFQWPPTQVQREIADVIAALDDKVECNQRLAASAEQLAVAHVEAAARHITLRTLAEMDRGQVSIADFESMEVDHFSLPAFDVAGVPDRCSGSSIKSGKFRLSQPAVLVSKLNPQIPRVWHAQPRSGVLALASTEFVVLLPRDGLSSEELWAACAAPAFITTLTNRVSGTTGSHQRVRPEDVMDTTVADVRSISDETRAAVRTLVDRAGAARLENADLWQLRASILAPLLTGELRVGEADQLVGKVL
jgi:type I restriction enzyme, S subunit